jgi:hypothetical protein
MLTTNDTLPHPFTILASVVRDFCSSGRRALGATLKPELYRRYRVTEYQLGFARFGDFLRAAERAGFVQVIPTPGGDLEVWPPNVQPQPTQQRIFDASPQPVAPPTPTAPSWSVTPRNDSPVRVRIDLWNAFTSFSARWVYDPARDIAFRAQISQPEPELAGGAPPIQIPGGRERTIDWMRSFAEMQDPQVKSRLIGTLDGGETSPYQFNSSIRGDLRLLKAWHRYHVRQVVAAIETWAASNNVRPKEVTSPYTRRSRVYWPVAPVGAEPPAPRAIPEMATPVPPPLVSAFPVLPPAPTTPATATVATLTPRLATLIDQLIDELLRLRGTLQVIDPKY